MRYQIFNSLILMFCLFEVNAQSPIKQRTAKDYAYRKRIVYAATSRLFVIDTMVWCKDVAGEMPVEKLSSLNTSATATLWVQLRGDASSLEALQKGAGQPAYIKFFRSTTYGLVAEKLANQISELGDEEGARRQTALSRCEASVREHGFFVIRVWTSPITFRYPGDYSLKLVDIENNSITGRGTEILQITVE